MNPIGPVQNANENKNILGRILEYRWPTQDILNHPNIRESSTGCGWTPLHAAFYFSNKELTEKLLKQGALILKDKYGRFPWELPTYGGNPNQLKIEYLLKETLYARQQGYGVSTYTWPNYDILTNPNMRETSTGWAMTPLHAAVYFGDTSLIKELFSRGAVVLRDKFNRWPHEIPYYCYAKSEGRLLSENLIKNSNQFKQTKEAEQREAEQKAQAQEKARYIAYMQQQAEAAKKAEAIAAEHQNRVHWAVMNQLQAQDQNRLVSMNEWMGNFQKQVHELTKPQEFKPTPISIPALPPVDTQREILQRSIDAKEFLRRNEFLTKGSGGGSTYSGPGLFAKYSGPVPFVSRNSGTESLLLLADASSHPDYFTGFNGAQCSYSDIAIASVIVDAAQSGKGGGAILNQIEKHTTNDFKWECAPENIQPSTLSSGPK